MKTTEVPTRHQPLYTYLCNVKTARCTPFAFAKESVGLILQSPHLRLDMTIYLEDNEFYYQNSKGQTRKEICMSPADMAIQIRLMIWWAQFKAWVRGLKKRFF